MLTSTLIIRIALYRLIGKPESEQKHFPSSGLWVGFFESILIFVFVIEREYSALAIVFAAKQFLGPPKTVTDATRLYYHLGSLINLAVAVVFAIIARVWISQFMGILFV